MATRCDAIWKGIPSYAILCIFIFCLDGAITQTSDKDLFYPFGKFFNIASGSADHTSWPNVSMIESALMSSTICVVILFVNLDIAGSSRFHSYGVPPAVLPRCLRVCYRVLDLVMLSSTVFAK